MLLKGLKICLSYSVNLKKNPREISKSSFFLIVALIIVQLALGIDLYLWKKNGPVLNWIQLYTVWAYF